MVFKKIVALAKKVDRFLLPIIPSSYIRITKTIILNGVKLEPGSEEYKKQEKWFDDVFDKTFAELKEAEETLKEAEETLKKAGREIKWK